MHTANEKDNIIFYELLFCLSNLATGQYETQYLISKSDLPKLIIQIMKEKIDNKIYFEGVHFFNNIISDCNKETFHIISEYHPFKLYSKGLECTDLIDNIDLTLKAITTLIEKNREIYNTLENLRIDFYTCLIYKKLYNLSNHKNEIISQDANKILKYFEDKMNIE